MRLDRARSSRRIVHEDAGLWPSVGRGAEDLSDALGHCALPARPDEQIETGCGAIHLASEQCRCVDRRLINPEAIAGEFRYWMTTGDCSGLTSRRHTPRLVRAGDDSFVSNHVVGQHDDPIEQRRRDPGRHRRFRQMFGGETLVENVDQRPCPKKSICVRRASACSLNLHVCVGAGRKCARVSSDGGIDGDCAERGTESG